MNHIRQKNNYTSSKNNYVESICVEEIVIYANDPLFIRRSETLRYLTQKTGKMRLRLILIIMDHKRYLTAISLMSMVILPIIITIINIIIRLIYKIQDIINSFTDLTSEDQLLVLSGNLSLLMVRMINTQTLLMRCLLLN